MFTLAKDVVQEVDKLFTNSPYIHLGGDEVSSNCWNLRPAIQDFMAKNNIANYGELQMYWRKQIKSVLSKDRKVVFWRNDAKDVTTTTDDVLQYWGSQNDTSRSIASHILVTSNTTSKIVLSPSDILYLNKGHGNLWLNASQGQYSVWR